MIINEYDLICSQSDAAVSSLKLGLFPVSYNGCGVVAVYNLLLLTGNYKSFSCVLNICKKGLLFGGIFGMFSFNMKKALKYFGFEFYENYSLNNFFEAFESGRVFIFRIKNGKSIFSSEHWFTAVKNNNGCIAAFNIGLYNGVAVFNDFDDLYNHYILKNGGKILKVFIIDSKSILL